MKFHKKCINKFLIIVCYFPALSISIYQCLFFANLYSISLKVEIYIMTKPILICFIASYFLLPQIKVNMGMRLLTLCKNHDVCVMLKTTVTRWFFKPEHFLLNVLHGRNKPVERTSYHLLFLLFITEDIYISYFDYYYI